MKITRIYATKDGESQFGENEIPIETKEKAEGHLLRLVLVPKFHLGIQSGNSISRTRNGISRLHSKIEFWNEGNEVIDQFFADEISPAI